jgi:DNA-directed RNA polymerase subunit alpha
MISNYSLSFPSIKSNLVEKGDNSFSLIVEPLLPGFGYSLGNSLRRIFLSSIPGFAVTKIKINDIAHEYQAIEGVVEDAMNIILNLKNLRVTIKTDEEKAILSLSKDGAGEVYAKDFDKNASVEVINQDLYICTLDKGGKLDIEVEIERGVGYLPVEQIQADNQSVGQYINVDALFSPVKSVAFDVEKVRVGDKTNFDKIEIRFETDGSVEAKEIVDFALGLAVDLFQKIHSSFVAKSDFAVVEAQTKTTKDASEDTQESKEIDLPKRIKNILEKNEITTNSQLKEKLTEVEEFAGITEKAMTQIREYVKGLK